MRALSAALGKPLPYDTLAAVRARMAEIAPHLDRLDAVTPAAWGSFGADRKLNRAPFASPVANFYMTDPISRASLTMAACTAAFATTDQPRRAADA